MSYTYKRGDSSDILFAIVIGLVIGVIAAAVAK